MRHLAWAGTATLLLAAPWVHAEPAQEKQPLVITSDRLEMDDKRHQATFSGHVLVVEGAMRMTAETMTVVYQQETKKKGNRTEVREVRAEGQVRLQDGVHQGSAGRAHYDTQRRTLELIGGGKEPATIQSEGQNRLEGEKILLQLSQERRVEKVVAEGGEGGRVRARISPETGEKGSAKGGGKMPAAAKNDE